MNLLGHRCPFCGTYIKSWKRTVHEKWHAEQVVAITKLLCTLCFTEHGKTHVACKKHPDCHCSCNAWSQLPDEGGE